jgi:hypothetical protein
VSKIKCLHFYNLKINSTLKFSMAAPRQASKNFIAAALPNEQVLFVFALQCNFSAILKGKSCAISASIMGLIFPALMKGCFVNERRLICVCT